MNRLIRKLLPVVLCVLVSIGCLPGIAIHGAQRSANDIISEMIVYYRDFQDQAQTDILRLLDELEDISPTQARAWGQIMDFWKTVNSENYTNLEVLPDGLPDDDSLCIVILGFALNADGTMKDELISRLTTGLNSANKYPNAYVAVTGGGTASQNPDVTEGQQMGDWLLEQGLDPDRLIIENKAPDTVGNARNTFAILKESYPSVTSLAMVTSDYHIPRGSILFYSTCMLAAAQSNEEPLAMVSNAGCYTGSQGYESIGLQASGVASTAGVSLPSAAPALSLLTDLSVHQDAPYEKNGELALEVSAGYDRNFSRDVSDLATISDFDPSLGSSQTITVSYAENGIEISLPFSLDQTDASVYDSSALRALVQECENLNLQAYTPASASQLSEALAFAQKILQQQSPAKEDCQLAFRTLSEAKNALRLLGNLAASKSVSASCNQKDAYKITDGVISTSNYWASVDDSGQNVDASDAWFVIDLGGVCDLSQIIVYPYYSGTRVYQYELFISDDQESWTSLGAQTSQTPVTAEGIIHEVSASGRYVRLQGIHTSVAGRDDINNIHIIEMKVYGQDTDNLAWMKPVVSSGTDTSAASSAGSADQLVNDGDLSTYWDAGQYQNRPWVTIDLEDIYALDSLSVVNYYARNDRYYNYEIYASLDGESYTLLHAKEGASANSTAQGDTIEIAAPWNARYIKLVGTYNSANASFHLNELKAFGQAASGVWKEAREQLELLVEQGQAIHNPNESLDALIQQALEALSNPAAEIEEFQTLAQAIQEEMSSLLCWDLLEMAVLEAENLKSDNALTHVNQLVVSQFETALSHAKTLLESRLADQKMIDDAWLQLAQAIHMLGFTSDFSSLDQLILQAQAIDPALYEPEGLEALACALEYALQVKNDPTALNEGRIAQAEQKLLDALNQLILLPDQLDTRLLEWLIQAVEPTDLTLYVPSSIDPFALAFKQAKAVLSNPESQEEINQAVYALHEAWLQLRLAPSEEMLQTLQDFLRQTQQLQMENFTATQFARLISLRDQVAEALDNPNLNLQEAQNLISQIESVQSLLNQTGGNTDSAVNVTKTSAIHSADSSVSTAASFLRQLPLFLGMGLLAGAALLTSAKKKEK